MERLIKIGQLQPRLSATVERSRMGLSMEKLDRNAFDPEKVYDKVAALGVKWIRLQSGWQKTEKRKGVYDFSWLDRQVDNLLQRGLVPWLCLCYGNVLYDELAGQYQGAVGCPPIRSEEARQAWVDYVGVTAKHFAGRIQYYEVWNEPEGSATWRPEPSTTEYADFCILTSRAVKAADPDAKIITGSFYRDTVTLFNRCFERGTLEVSDAISYHSYHYDERFSMQKGMALRELIKSYGKDVEVIQGESGSQSKTGSGTLKRIRTDEQMQTKQLMRHTVADLLAGVKFTSVFSCVDMAENLDAKEGVPITTCGYFGLLGAEFDPTTGSIMGDYYEKPSYYAFQNLCSLFNDLTEPVYIASIFTPTQSPRINGFDCPIKDVLCGGIKKPNGSRAFVYWNTTDLITVKDYEGSVTFELSGIQGEVRLIDPRDGAIYEIPETILTTEGNRIFQFKNLPIKDYPLILTFGDFI